MSDNQDDFKNFMKRNRALPPKSETLDLGSRIWNQILAEKANEKTKPNGWKWIPVTGLTMAALLSGLWISTAKKTHPNPDSTEVALTATDLGIDFEDEDNLTLVEDFNSLGL
jgi:hypothetical protein